MIRARRVNWLSAVEDLMRFGGSIETVAFGEVFYICCL